MRPCPTPLTAPTVHTADSAQEQDAPLAGVVVEPSRIQDPATGSIPATLPAAPITGSLQERAQTNTAPNT